MTKSDGGAVKSPEEARPSKTQTLTCRDCGYTEEVSNWNITRSVQCDECADALTARDAQ